MFIIIASIASILSVALTFMSAFPKGFPNMPTCEDYIKHTYMYLVTYIILITLFVAILDKYLVISEKTMNYLYDNIGLLLALGIINFIIYLVIFIVTLAINKKHVALKHFMVLLFLIWSSFIYKLIIMEVGGEEMLVTLGITAVLFIIITIIAFKFQDMLTSHITWTFFIMFIVIVVLEAIASLIAPFSIFTALITMVVLLFVVYIAMVHTKRMIENSKNCEKEGGPDYINESLSFLIDMKNIFIRILSLRGRH